MKKSLTPKFFCALLSGIVVYGVLLATPVQARTLVNLTTQGATITAGNAKCKGQPYFRYVGGKPDLFQSPADPAYPSANLLSFMNSPPGVQGIVDYDVPTLDEHFGDSFNLQNTRSVCHAVIQVRMQGNGGTNDALHIGHVEDDLTFTTVAQILTIGNPPPPPTPVVNLTYAFTPTGRNLLSLITGVNLNKTPLDSILDIYLQDDTKIDFIMLWVWYGPNCSEVSPPTC